MAWREEAADETPIPPAKPKYKGREIAVTMHYLGAPWLMRESREREEDCTTLLKALNVKPGQVVCDMGCGNGFYTLQAGQAGRRRRARCWQSTFSREMLHMLAERAKEAEHGQHRADPGHAGRPEAAQRAAWI